MLIDDIRELVYQACLRSENILSPAFFDQHLVVVAECATRLAGTLGADAEVVDLAAYLHDITAVLDPTTMPDHPRLSAEFATRILVDRGYRQDRIATVARAIASHSEPLPPGSASSEEVCLSNADAAARILRPAYWLYFSFGIRKSGFDEGRQWLKSLFEKQWSLLIEPARELVGPQYAVMMDVLTR